MPIEEQYRPLFHRTGILVGGRRFEEWTDYSIGADMFNPSDAFSMRCGPMPRDILREVLPGHDISIYFGNDTEDHIILGGWIEGFNHVTDKEYESTDISGRDLASDLIENSVPQGLDVRGKTFYDLAQIICNPFDIPVLCTNEANRLAIANKKKWKKAMLQYGLNTIQYNNHVVKIMGMGPYLMTHGAARSVLANSGVKHPVAPPWVGSIFKTLDDAEPQDGESCWDFLVRYAEKLEVHMWMSASGMLVIQRPRYDQDPLYTFIVSESNPEQTNCRMRYGLDIGGMPTKLTRTGKYVGKGEKRDRLETFYESTKIIPTSDENTIIPEGSIKVASHFTREKWTHDQESANLSELKRKNYYDMVAAETGFQDLEVIVPGHDQGGNLYTFDTVARVRHEPLGIDRNFYVAACTYDLDPKREYMSGPTTTLRLTPLNAWSPMA